MKSLFSRLMPMHRHALTLAFIIAFLMPAFINAQTWPATAPSIIPSLAIQRAFYPSTSLVNVSHISTDMYTDYSSGSAGNWVTVTAYQYNNGGIDSIMLVAHENFSAALVFLRIGEPGGVGARLPDIAITEADPSNPNLYGTFEVQLVYLTSSGQVQHIRVPLGGAFGNYTGSYGAFGWGSTIPSPNTLNNPGKLCNYAPRVDACAGGTVRPFGGGNTYAQMDSFAIVWHERNGTVNEIYTLQGYTSFGGGITLTPIFLFRGTSPDVASVLEDDNFGNYQHKIYISYLNAFGTRCFIRDYYYASATLSASSLQETVTSYKISPRIEAPNVHNTVLNSNNVHWTITACIFNSPYYEIHTYDDLSGVINYSASIPMAPGSWLLTGIDGFMPNVGIGCGRDGYAPGSATDIGNTDYTMGWLIAGYELNALSVDNVTGAVTAGYDQVNNTPILSYPGSDAVFSVTSSSNSGKDLFVSWFDGDTLFCKKCGNTFAFKHGTNATTMNLVKGKVSLYPNPAGNSIFITNVEKGSFTITSLTGSVVKSGTIDQFSNEVNITDLAAGTYIANIREDDKTHSIKFIKQ